MIRLTCVNDNVYFVNFATVSHLIRKDEHTKIYFVGDFDLSLQVLETPEEIMQKLNAPTEPHPFMQTFQTEKADITTTPEEPKLSRRDLMIKACAKDRGAVNKLLASHNVTKLSEASEEVQTLIEVELKKLI